MTSGFRFARALYSAAVSPAGPDPITITLRTCPDTICSPRPALRSCDVLVDDFLERVLVGQTDNLFDHLSALEQEERRNAADTELERGIGVLVDVQLTDHHPAVIVAGELFHGGSEAATRTAPFRPEINEYGFFAVDRLIEVAVRDRLNLVGCHRFCAPYTL